MLQNLYRRVRGLPRGNPTIDLDNLQGVNCGHQALSPGTVDL